MQPPISQPPYFFVPHITKDRSTPPPPAKKISARMIYIYCQVLRNSHVCFLWVGSTFLDYFFGVDVGDQKRFLKSTTIDECHLTSFRIPFSPIKSEQHSLKV